MNKGKIFIISGPSGVGKDTVIKGILRKFLNFVMVKSYTTRPPRASDEVGNRVFVSEKEFKQMIKKREMLEWAKVHSWYYGRKNDDIVRHLKQGKNVIMDMDVKGAVSCKKMMPEVVSIFIKYENPDCFIKRLRKNRPEISAAELKTRAESMQKEMKYEKYYDYSVVNPEGQPQKTIETVAKIMKKYII